MTMTLEIYRYNRALLLSMLEAGHETLCREACINNNEVQIRRLDILLEALRKQLHRPRQDERPRPGPVRPPVATTSP